MKWIKCLLLTLLLLTLSGVDVFGQLKPTLEILKLEAPDTLDVAFQTNEGEFFVRSYRAWGNDAADRFYQMIKADILTGALFYRIVPDFVVQFGASNDVEVNEAWHEIPIPDEPIVSSNTQGRMAFAAAGRNTRSIHLFINLKDNVRLDSVSEKSPNPFPPFAEVISGFDVLNRLHANGRNTYFDFEDSVKANGVGWLRDRFPFMDSIQTVSIINRDQRNEK